MTILLLFLTILLVFTITLLVVEKLLFQPFKGTATKWLHHELGHILDSSRGWKAYSSNWSGWEEMKPYSPTQVYNEGEAFAEAFAAYFARPEKLKKTAPNAYTYIESIILNMN